MQQITYYDADFPPSPADWLALPEQNRIRAVLAFHMQRRLKSKSSKGHAALT